MNQGENSSSRNGSMYAWHSILTAKSINIVHNFDMLDVAVLNKQKYHNNKCISSAK